MRWSRLWRWTAWLFVVTNVALLVTLVLVVVVPLPDTTTTWSNVVEYRDGSPSFVFLASDEKWRLPVTIENVDPKFVEALVALEDKRFYSHDGVDSLAIVRAAFTDITRGRRVSGGSTLSMQLARLLEPRTRTIPHKLIDMFRATQLDLRLSKQQILAAYLARTPYGGNFEGVESAAWSYFGHGAKHLAPLEIATLLAVPQGPARYAPSPANAERLRVRRDSIVEKLIAANVFAGPDAIDARTAMHSTPVPERLTPMPRAAPHVANSLRARFPNRLTIRTTLDAGLQQLVEKQVAMQAAALTKKGIYNASVVVVDHHAREVVALVGNLDFTDTKHGGQIAMFDRPRSPGSTLKPLLYAMAIDRGDALPGYLVADIPNQYGTYRPKNFDNDYAGLVTLRESLGKSLNIPFIDLLDRIGVSTFIKELSRMDISAALSFTPDEYGLSIIVGGIEIAPIELAGIYATLAEDGAYRPLRLVDTDEVAAKDTRIYGAGAAYLTRDALAQKDRPDFPERRGLTRIPTGIHWKTGTSFGFRDAWSAGSDATYTAVVWTGNADNTPSADLIGSQAAGPLLFDVLEGVAGRSVAHAVPSATPPDELVPVEVCSYSGYLAGEACDHRTKALASIHAVPTKKCPYHRAFDVDRATGRAVLPACRADGHDYDRKNFVVLPSTLAAWLADRDRTIPDAPLFDESCAGTAELAAPPSIRSPVEGQVVTLIPGVPPRQQQVPLLATTQASHISWFVDGAFIATVPASQRIAWIPTPGKHEIVASDDVGRKARRTLDVK